MVTRAFLVGEEASDADAGGLAAIVRQALSLQAAGVDTFHVVAGSADRLRSDRRVHAVVTCGAIADHAAAAIVARAGCVWHPSISRRLAQASIDANDAAAIGAIDSGLFLCGADRIASTIDRLLGGGAAGTTDARVVGVGPNEFVVTPRSEHERSHAVTLLLRTLTKPSDGLVSRHLHRPISTAITRRLLPFPVTPNAMTIVAALFGIGAVVVAARGGYASLLAGALLFETQNILDGCDGEIARLKYLGSRVGEWLDQIIDDVLNIAFLAAVGHGLARGGTPWAADAVVVAVAAQVIHLIGLYAGLLVKAGGRGSVARLRWFAGSGATDGPRERLLGDVTRRDFLSLAYVVCAAVGATALSFAWHVAIVVGSAVVTTIQWIVWKGPGVQETDGPATAAATDSAPEAAARRV